MAPIAKAAAARCEKGPGELLFLSGVLDGKSLLAVALEAVGFEIGYFECERGLIVVNRRLADFFCGVPPL